MDLRDAWLVKLGARLQISELTFNRKGRCQLMLDDELTITIDKSNSACYDANTLALFTRLPVYNLSTEIIQSMLVENRHHIQRSSPVVSLSAQRDAIELYLQFIPRESDMMDDAIDQLISHIDHWRCVVRYR